MPEIETFSPQILSKHKAILGMSGSGKTCTAKLEIEQVVATGGRVCVMDPIKSDYWGLTSSSNGKHAGLPFNILGGPRAHVPLHPGAGKTIGELVGSGALRLSIIDMADFPMGGLAEFFIDFAPSLIRSMRGVLHLVIDEAHEFAPKERSGIGQENMLVYHVKKLATAGRSRGLRITVVTQRTQALHNAVFGMVNTIVAHRLISPADQQPVMKWLKGNAAPGEVKTISASLSSLEDGEAWVCHRGANQRRQFPRIDTFDNTAAPTDDSDLKHVKTAPVDQNALRELIGEAARVAEENDPELLRKKIVDLQSELKLKHGKTAPTHVQETVDDAASQRAIATAVTTARAEMKRSIGAVVTEMRATAAHHAKRIEAVGASMVVLSRLGKELHDDAASFATSLGAFGEILAAPAAAPGPSFLQKTIAMPRGTDTKAPAAITSPRAAHAIAPENGDLSRGHRRILDSLAWWERLGVVEPTVGQVAFKARYRAGGGSFKNTLSNLSSLGYVDRSDGTVKLSETGAQEAAYPESLGTLAEYHAEIMATVGARLWKILKAVIQAGRPVTPEDIGTTIGKESGGGSFKNDLSRLSSLDLVVREKGTVRPSAVTMPKSLLV